MPTNSWGASAPYNFFMKRELMNYITPIAVTAILMGTTAVADMSLTGTGRIGVQIKDGTPAVAKKTARILLHKLLLLIPLSALGQLTLVLLQRILMLRL